MVAVASHNQGCCLVGASLVKSRGATALVSRGPRGVATPTPGRGGAAGTGSGATDRKEEGGRAKVNRENDEGEACGESASGDENNRKRLARSLTGLNH